MDSPSPQAAPAVVHERTGSETDTPRQAFMRDLVESKEGVFCNRCKCCEMDFDLCGECEGEGRTQEGDLYEEDPLYYSPEDTEVCHMCNGKGGWWACSCDVNGKHGESQNSQIQEGEASPGMPGSEL